MLMIFADKFKKVFGRDPTENEIQSYTRFIGAMDIKENDALLLFFLFQERNLNRLENIPQLVKVASSDATKDAKERAKSAVDGAVSDAIPALVKAVNAQVSRTAESHASAQKFKWAALMSGAALALVVASSLLGWYYGRQEVDVARQAAFAAGSQSNAFLNTLEGKIAFDWYRGGTLSHLIYCDRPGWYRTKDGVCIAGPGKDGSTYGWKLP